MNEPQVIYQDEQLLVICKPAGFITTEASTTKGQPVVQTWIKDNFDLPILKFPTLRNGIVHRIDKETSGILLIAKTKQAHKHLQKQFKNRTVRKTYLALLSGKLDISKGDVKIPLGRLPWNRERFGVLPQGKMSESAFEVQAYYKDTPGNLYTLCEFYPKTGRTHQIRIHAKYLGHPIVSDEFYAGRKRARDDRKWCPRLFLHAYKIRFTHPQSREEVSFKAELPGDLQKALRPLQKL